MKLLISSLVRTIEGNPVKEWIELPTTDEKIKEVFEKIGMKENDETIVNDQKEMNGFKIAEKVNIYALNEMLKELEKYNKKEVTAIVEAWTGDIPRVLEILKNHEYTFFDCYTMEDVKETSTGIIIF